MKKIVFILCIAVALCSLTQWAAADTVQTVGPPNGVGPYHYGNGGEFTVLPSGSISGLVSNYSSWTRDIYQTGTFQTFCLEAHEAITGWSNPHTAVLNSRAMNGGVLPLGTGDPISIGTAYLYFQFATGTLQNYKYSGTTAERQASASLLQNAFWYLENEDGGVDNYYVNLVQGMFGETGAMDDNNGTYRVAALNVGNGGQDLLIVTPEPITMLLLGLGLVGLAGVRRSKK